MKWIRTHHGDKAHAVSSHDSATTMCGIPIRYAAAIVAPGFDDRCGNCDKEWRRKAKAERPKRQKRRSKDTYLPRFTFRDWEEI
jgi:hypothetical protein